jgi:hypothetical protein
VAAIASAGETAAKTAAASKILTSLTRGRLGFAAMAGSNGNRRPPRPRIELISPARSKSEAAAIVAGLEQFLADTARPAAASGPAQSPWQRAALEEGIAARQVSGSAWGPAPR